MKKSILICAALTMLASVGYGEKEKYKLIEGEGQGIDFISIGKGAESNGTDAIALGSGAKTLPGEEIAPGDPNTAVGAVAVGGNSKTVGHNGVAMGRDSYSGADGVSLGYMATNYGLGVAIGEKTYVAKLLTNGNGSGAIGGGSIATEGSTVSFGFEGLKKYGSENTQKIVAKVLGIKFAGPISKKISNVSDGENPYDVTNIRQTVEASQIYITADNNKETEEFYKIQRNLNDKLIKFCRFNIEAGHREKIIEAAKQLDDYKNNKNGVVEAVNEMEKSLENIKKRAEKYQKEFLDASKEYNEYIKQNEGKIKEYVVNKTGDISKNMGLSSNNLAIYGTKGRIKTTVNKKGEINIDLDDEILSKFDGIQNTIDTVNEKTDLALSGVSSAVAMANLPQVSGDRKFNLAASYGYYGGSHSVAVGLSGTNDKQNFTYKLSGAVNSKGNLAFGIGAGVMLGSVNNKDKVIEQLKDENKEMRKEINELKEVVRKLIHK